MKPVSFVQAAWLAAAAVVIVAAWQWWLEARSETRLEKRFRGVLTEQQQAMAVRMQMMMQQQQAMQQQAQKPAMQQQQRLPPMQTNEGPAMISQEGRMNQAGMRMSQLAEDQHAYWESQGRSADF